MKAIVADLVLDGNGGRHEGSGVLFTGDRIGRIVSSDECEKEVGSAGVTRFPGCCIIPGMVNCHSHLVMPGNGASVEEAMEVSDEVLLGGQLVNTSNWSGM